MTVAQLVEERPGTLLAVEGSRIFAAVGMEDPQVDGNVPLAVAVADVALDGQRLLQVRLGSGQVALFPGDQTQVVQGLALALAVAAGTVDSRAWANSERARA